MTFFRSPLFVLLLLVFACVAASAFLTGLYVWDMSMGCENDGGLFSVEGGTAFCRY